MHFPFVSNISFFFFCQIAVYKRKLFANLVGKAETVLEIGIGAGPNIKYYNNIPNVSVLGVDPNPKMESHARKSAIEAGVKSENFKFIHAVMAFFIFCCEQTRIKQEKNHENLEKMKFSRSKYCFILGFVY